MSKIKVPKPITGYGYVGAFNRPQNTIGWMLPPCVGAHKAPGITQDTAAKGERFFLCKIIVMPIVNRNGRPITRIAK